MAAEFTPLMDALVRMSEKDVDACAAIFAQISYREYEFGGSTEILFKPGDPETRLHFRMAFSALLAFANGKTAGDLCAEEPYYPRTEGD